jgi:4-hydroxybenzoate polyprenyltransferase
MKRFTNHPQIVLGLAFAWGGVDGLGRRSSRPMIEVAGRTCSMLGAICWVVGYDTIYALQDIEDDAIVGIGSTARAYGEHVRMFIAVMFALTVGLIGAALAKIGVGPAAWLGLLAFSMHLGWQVATVKRDDWVRALMLFRANRDAGLLLFAGLALDAILAAA